MSEPRPPAGSPGGDARPWWTERRAGDVPTERIPSGAPAADPETRVLPAGGVPLPPEGSLDHLLAPAPTRPRRPRGSSSRVVTVVAVLAIVALVLVIAPWDSGRRQAIADQVTVWLNPPSTRVEELADRIDLSGEGRRIFFATQPRIETATNFNANCEVEGQTVLGCYVGDRIHVFEVTDERLAGTVEVTAAHEMLHAAYERLSTPERARIDREIAEAVAAIPDDDPVREIMASYPESQQAGEWHSRLGTEFADLPAELEEYYGRYFDDRSTVLALERQSTAAFDEVEAEIDALVAKIDKLGAQLERRGDAYEADLAQLNSDIEEFNSRVSEGDYASLEEAQQVRDELIQRSDELEADRQDLNDDTDRYNAMVGELEDLDARYADLYSSLDSTRAPDDVSG